MTRGLLYLYVFTLPSEALFAYAFDVRTAWKPYRLIALACILAFLFKSLATRRPVRIDGFDKIFLTIIGWGLCATLFWKTFADQGELAFTFSDLSLILLGYTPCVILKNELTSLRDVERFLLTGLAGTVFSMAVGSLLGSEADRYRALFVNPNSLAIAISSGLLILLGYLLFARRRRPAALAACAGFVLLAIALLSTGSRGALVSLFLALVAMFFVAFLVALGGRRMNASRYAVAALILCLGGVFANRTLHQSENEVAFERLQLDHWKSGGGRFDTWRGAFNVASNHYFLGVGIGQYRTQHVEAMKQLEKLYTPSVVNARLGAHSEYFSLLAEYGLPCLLLHLGVLLTLGRRLWARLRENGLENSFAVPVCLSILVLNAAGQVTANVMLSPGYYVAIGLITACALRAPEPA